MYAKINGSGFSEPPVLSAAGAYISGGLRFVSGATAEEPEAGNAAGNRMPSGVLAVIVVSAAMAAEPEPAAELFPRPDQNPPPPSAARQTAASSRNPA